MYPKAKSFLANSADTFPSTLVALFIALDDILNLNHESYGSGETFI